MNAIMIKVGLYLLLVIVVLFIVNKSLKKIGLVDNESRKEKKVNDKAMQNITMTDIFNPAYHQGKLFNQLAPSTSELYAKDIHNAFGVFNDDESMIYSTFKKLDNVYNVSQVSASYYELYQDDLRADLLQYLNRDEIGILDSIISSLNK